MPPKPTTKCKHPWSGYLLACALTAAADDAAGMAVANKMQKPIKRH